MRLFQPLLSALVLCTLLGQGPKLAAQADAAALSRIEAALVAAKKTDQPELALEHDLAQLDALVAALLTPTRNRDWERNIADLEILLTHINRRGLTPANGARADALAALLLAERIQIDTHAAERWHAIGSIQRLESTLRALFYAAAGLAPGSALNSIPAIQRYAALATFLQQLPLYWESARGNLNFELLEWNVAAAERMPRLHELIKAEAERELPASMDQDTQATWRAIGERVEASGREFELWLRTPLERAGSPPTLLGADRWLRLAQAASGSQLNLAKTKWRVLTRIADAEHRYGKRWRSKPTKAPMPNPERHLESVSAAAAAFLGQAGLLGELSLPKINARFISRMAQPAPLDLVAAMRPKNQVHLFLDPELMSASRAMLTAIALREALPQTWFGGERALQQSRAMSEAWRLYALDFPLRIDWVKNELQAVPGLAGCIAHLQVIEAARFLAALELHAENYSRVEASERFLQRTGLSKERATGEIKQAMLDPLYGIGFLAWMELGALEQELGTGQVAIQRCIELSSSQPQLRPRDILNAVRASAR